jgi:hypothetical protein
MLHATLDLKGSERTKKDRRRIFGTTRDDVTRVRRRMHNEELAGLLFVKYYSGDRIKDDEMDGT